MRKIILLLTAVFMFTLPATAQTLSDTEILKLVKDAQENGMTQQQVMVMLSQKGVSQEQMVRLSKEYKEGRLTSEYSQQSPNKGKEDERIRVKDGEENNPFYNLADSVIDADSMALNTEPEKKVIFGHNIFNNPKLTFEPSLNIATPTNYMLGPGDEVFIDVWGDSQELIRKVISPDGYIMVDRIGPVHLNGLTIEQANRRIKNVFAENSYAGISTGAVSVNLTLGQIRSITVNVMGEVKAPGTYTLPSLSSAFHALYMAGGLEEIGSLRSVKLFRKGKEIADMDIYEYIFEGKNDSDIILQDADVVIVQPYQNLIEIEGNVKRPMIYEVKDGETLADLLRYAGNFTGDAYKKNIRIIRKSGREHQIYNVSQNDFGKFLLVDGDEIDIESVLPRFENKVEIKGAVYREGLYAIDESVNSVATLIEKAEGLRGDAFLNRAVIQREQADMTLEVISVDVAGLMNGTTTDIALEKNDILYIPSIFDLREEYFVTVKGEVRNPGVVNYADNMSLEDVVIQCGGLKESASIVKVDVARRIKNPKSTLVADLRAETFTLTLKDGYIVDGPAGFELKPFDEIYVRRSPGYQEQQNVIIEGEVLFEGEYVIAKKGERLSDLVGKAGGFTPDAYLKGARLMRKTTQQEKELIQKALKNLMDQQAGNDTLTVDLASIGEYYSVGIELEKALDEPRSSYDVTLKEGDRLIVPEYTETVKISGSVMHPNTVVYKEKKRLKYYVKQAGGFADRSKKGKSYVVYMNGTIAKGKYAKIQPGCEVMVPKKPERTGAGFANMMGVTTTTASLAAVVASIVNMTK